MIGLKNGIFCIYCLPILAMRWPMLNIQYMATWPLCYTILNIWPTTLWFGALIRFLNRSLCISVRVPTMFFKISSQNEMKKLCTYCNNIVRQIDIAHVDWLVSRRELFGYSQICFRENGVNLIKSITSCESFQLFRAEKLKTISFIVTLI